MAINNIVPRVHGEGKLGISNKKWEEVNAINVSSSTITSTKVRVEDLLTTSDQDLLTSGNNIQISKNIDGQYEISSNALSSTQTASTIQAGIIEIASSQEISDGTSNDKAITPSQLKSEIKLADGNDSEFQITNNSGDFISASISQDGSGNVLPVSDDTINIGSQSKRIKSIFLANNTSDGFDGTYDSLVNKPNFAGGINYKSTYDAATNAPDLTLIDNEVGDLYKVSVAGNIGNISLLPGDHIIFNSDITTSTLSDLEAYVDKIDNTESVTSVNNQVGSVDIGFFDLSDTEGSIPQDGNYVVAVTGSTLSLTSSNNLTKWEEDANGDLIPTVTSTYSIGNANNRVKDLYLTNNSINFESGSLSVTQGTINFAGNALAKYNDIKRNFVDLEDVNASSIADGQFLKFSGDKFITEAAPSGESSLYEEVVILYNDDPASSTGDVTALNGLFSSYSIVTPTKNTLYKIKAANNSVYNNRTINLPSINNANKGTKITIENNYGNRVFDITTSGNLIYEVDEINSGSTSLYTLNIGYYIELVANKNNDWLITKKGPISDKDIVFNTTRENLNNSILTYNGTNWVNDRQSSYKDLQLIETNINLSDYSNRLNINSAEGKRHYKVNISGGQNNIGLDFSSARRVYITSTNTTDYPAKYTFYGSIFKLEVTTTDAQNRGYSLVGFHSDVVSLLKDNLSSPDSNNIQYHDLYAISGQSLIIYPGLVYTVIYEENAVYIIDIERNATGDSYKFNNGDLTLTSGSLYLDGTKLLTASDAISSTSFYSTTISASQTVPQITDVRRQHYNVTAAGATVTMQAGSGSAGGLFSVRNNSTSSIDLAFAGINYELADGTQGTANISIKPNVTRTFVWLSNTEVNETDVTALEYMSDVNIESPTSGQVLKYNGTNWFNAGDVGTYLPGLSDDQAHTITLGTGFDSTSGSISNPYNLVPQVTNNGSLGKIDKAFASVNANAINVTGTSPIDTGEYSFELEGNDDNILNVSTNSGKPILKLATNNSGTANSVSLSTETAYLSASNANVMIDLPYELDSQIADGTVLVTTNTSPMSYKFENVDPRVIDGTAFYNIKSAFMLDERIESFTDTTKNEVTPSTDSVSCKTYIFISRIADTLKTVNLKAPERIGQKFIIKNLSTSTNSINLQPVAGITFDDGQIASINVENNDAITLIADTNTNWILV